MELLIGSLSLFFGGEASSSHTFLNNTVTDEEMR